MITLRLPREPHLLNTVIEPTESLPHSIDVGLRLAVGETLSSAVVEDYGRGVVTSVAVDGININCDVNGLANGSISLPVFTAQGSLGSVVRFVLLVASTDPAAGVAPVVIAPDHDSATTPHVGVIGLLADLTTGVTSTLVAAINEVAGRQTSGGLVVFDHEPTTEEIDALFLRDTDGALTDITAPWVVWTPPPSPDTTPPVVTVFTGPSTSNSAVISGITLTATDAVGVTGYLINESATPPLAAAVNVTPAPTTYNAGTEGAKTLYAWARDAAGNVSAVYAPLAVTIDNAVPAFSTQPTVQSVTATTVTLAYGTSDAENDHYLLAGSSDGGTNWTTLVADETAGAGKTCTLSGLSYSTLYTLRLRLTPLTGDTTPVLSNTVQGTTAAHNPEFSVQPTVNDQIDGGIFSFTVSDALGHNLDIEFYDGSSYSRILSGVAAGAKTHAWTGQAAGSKTGCKFRVSDAGANAWIESSVVGTFSTSSPAIASVTAGSTQLTIDLTAPSGEAPDSYNGYHSASAGQAIGSMTQVVGIADPWVLTGLTNDVARYLKVTAIKGAIESLPSLESSGTPVASVETMTTGNTYGDDSLIFIGGGSRSLPATYDPDLAEFFLQSFDTTKTLAQQTGYAGLTRDGLSNYTFQGDLVGFSNSLSPGATNSLSVLMKIFKGGMAVPSNSTTTDTQAKFIAYLKIAAGPTYSLGILKSFGSGLYYLTAAGAWQSAASYIPLTELGARIIHTRLGDTHSVTIRKTDGTLIVAAPDFTEAAMAATAQSATDRLVIGDVYSITGKADYYHSKLTAKNVSIL